MKIHGSVTWSKDIIWGGIKYQQYQTQIRDFFKEFSQLFDATIIDKIDAHFTAETPVEAEEQIKSLLSDTVFDLLLAKIDDYHRFIQTYKTSFLIVNPTKEKFSDTLLNKNYYEILRIFSNELEKENSLLVVNGFSFRDEHILDLIKRSMVNPSLKILVFVYNEEKTSDLQGLFGTPKNNNITYVALDGERLSLDYFNQIMSHIHS